MIYQEARDLVKRESLFSTNFAVAHILAFIIIELPIIIDGWWEKQLVGGHYAPDEGTNDEG